MKTSYQLHKIHIWNQAFQDNCIKSGIPSDWIAKNHIEFWCSADYYRTQGINPAEASDKFYSVNREKIVGTRRSDIEAN